MATRSTISLKVKKEDIGKTFHFDENKLPGLLNCENGCIDKVGDVTIEKPYLVIYHHWDGYPEGVGETLVKKFNDYDTILNLLCGGDASTINGDTIVQYCAWRGEEWDDVKPAQSDTEPSVTEEYVYLFDDGVWYFKGYYDDEWVNLKEYLEKNTDEE